MTIKAKLMVGAMALALVGACTPPKYLMSNNYLGSGKITKFVLEPTSTSDEETLANAYVYVCDVEASGKASNCQETLLISQVVVW